MNNTEPIIEVKDLKVRLGGTWVLKGLDLTVNRGEILAIVGGSGSGKTTLLRHLLGLAIPKSGSIRVFGQEITKASRETMLKIQCQWGVLFQQSALFSSLSLLENVAFPLHEHTDLDSKTIKDLALLKILLAGLPVESATRLPAELSGGMQKRAGLARSLVLDPKLVFLDEPTSGLDPATAGAFDQLILNLQTTLGLTIVMVTHDVDSLWTVANRVAFLGEGIVLCVDTMEALVKNPNPEIQKFFSRRRGNRNGKSNHEKE